MNRREFIQAGFYGIVTSLSTRAVFYEEEKRQSLLGLQDQLEVISDREDSVEFDLYMAEKNHDKTGQMMFEQEIVWLHSVGTRLGAEFNSEGGVEGIGDARNISFVAASLALYCGQKFFEVFRAADFKRD